MSGVQVLATASVVGAGWASHSTWLWHRLRSARRDPLTGLAGRRELQARAGRMLARRACLVAFVDQDAFKAVNDTFGHGAGDRVLTRTARVLAEWAGPGAVVARLGGDEFTIVVPDRGGDVAGRAAGLRQALTGTVALSGGEPVAVSACVGVVLAPVGTPLTAALTAADTALYRAKQDRETGPGWALAPAVSASIPAGPARRHKRRGLSGPG